MSTNGGHDQLTLDQQVCFALAVADRRVVAAYRPFLEPLGLTHPQYLVMIALWEQSPTGMRQLGRRLALDSGTLSPLVTRLVAAGLLERRRGPDDRSVTVALTGKGEALRERARSVPQGVRDRLGLPEERLVEIRRVLLDLAAAADGTRTQRDDEGT